MGEAALLERVRPLKDVEKMDKSQLEERAKEYWKTITSIIAEKKELSKRLQEQDQQITEVQERLAAFMLTKQSKKGVDMERLALGPGSLRTGKETGHTRRGRGCTTRGSHRSAPRCWSMSGRPSSAPGWRMTMLVAFWMESRRRMNSKYDVARK